MTFFWVLEHQHAYAAEGWKRLVCRVETEYGQGNFVLFLQLEKHFGYIATAEAKDSAIITRELAKLMEEQKKDWYKG